MKIPINSAITCANKPKNKLANKLHIAFDGALNKDLVKKFHTPASLAINPQVGY
jgi:hypothetical protein